MRKFALMIVVTLVLLNALKWKDGDVEDPAAYPAHGSSEQARWESTGSGVALWEGLFARDPPMQRDLFFVHEPRTTQVRTAPVSAPATRPPEPERTPTPAMALLGTFLDERGAAALVMRSDEPQVVRKGDPLGDAYTVDDLHEDFIVLKHRQSGLHRRLALDE